VLCELDITVCVLNKNTIFQVFKHILFCMLHVLKSEGFTLPLSIANKYSSLFDFGP